MAKLIDQILEAFPEERILKADGFDDAVIGVDVNGYRLVYSIPLCLSILEAQGMTSEEACEYMEFNVIGAYLGDKTPIWCDTFQTNQQP